MIHVESYLLLNSLPPLQTFLFFFEKVELDNQKKALSQKIFSNVPIIEQQKRSDTLCVTVSCLQYYKVIVGMTVPAGLVGHMSYFANKKH